MDKLINGDRQKSINLEKCKLDPYLTSYKKVNSTKLEELNMKTIFQTKYVLKKSWNVEILQNKVKEKTKQNPKATKKSKMGTHTKFKLLYK